MFAEEDAPPAPEERPPLPTDTAAHLPPLSKSQVVQALASVSPRPAPYAARAKAGLGIIAAAGGAGVGAALGGPLGAAAGFVATGAVRNLYRAQGIASADPATQNQAARSLAIGVVGLGLAGYLTYLIVKKPRGHSDE